MTTLAVDMIYDLQTGATEYLSGTTVKASAIADVLEAYVREQIGSGADTRRIHDQGQYRITIHSDLDGDVVRAIHDCGNDDLCVGIVLDILRGLS